MKTTSILSTLAVALPALAAPAGNVDAPYKTWSALAISSGSDIMYEPINANGTYFYLKRSTKTYTPPNVGTYNQTKTIFAGGDSTLSLDVEVPGGQQVYVDTYGNLRYTEAHSADVGTGSQVTGFNVSSTTLQYNLQDFLACGLGSTEDYAYQIRIAAAATAPVTPASDNCIGFSFFISENTEAAAWEYA
ncbi:hypothetical protein BDV97DRAFT_425821 [Delphinella strobiligena]|nr:hypothetical protein BDV97DRAFT_425821 [Delphinella strobiligena]